MDYAYLQLVLFLAIFVILPNFAIARNYSDLVFIPTDTDTNIDDQSSIFVAPFTSHSTDVYDFHETQTETQETTENIGPSFSSSLHLLGDVENLGTTIATNVTSGAHSFQTNESTTATWTTDAATSSIVDVETTTSTTTVDEKFSDDIEYTIPNDSRGTFYYFYDEFDPSTTQISAQQSLSTESSFSSSLHLGDVKNSEIMTSTSVPDVNITSGAQSARTNESTTATWTTDAATSSIADVETTTSTTTVDKKFNDDIEYIIPNDDLSTAQISTEQSPVVNTPDICSSAECKTVASRMLSLMNHSKDPCEDFYEFACGEMRAQDNDRDTWDRLSKEINLINDDEALPHFQALKSFYTSCVEHEVIFNYTDRILQVRELVKEVGWIIDSRADPRSVDLTSLFAKLILRQSLPIFDVEVDIDSMTKTFILKLVPGQIHSMLAESGLWSALSESKIRCLIAEEDALQSPKLDLNKMYLSYLDCQEDQQIYLNSVESAVENLGLYSSITNWFTKTQRINELRTTIEWKFLSFLEELPAPNIVRKIQQFKEANPNYAVMTVRDLQDKYPLVNWKSLFEMITGNSISYDTQVETYFPDYIENVFKDDKSFTIIDINNALISMYAHSLYQNLVIPQARHHREDYCLKLSTKLFQDVSNNLYVQTWKNSDFINYQSSSLEIFSRLKNKLTTEVETEAKWLDEFSKQSLLRKLDAIKLVLIDQHDRYNYGSYLWSKYQINFQKNNWPANAVKMVTKYRRMLYSIQGSDFSTEKLWSFFINAHDSTPTSIYGLGLTVAPLGTMRKFIKNVPNYVNMIKIGLPLAREIGHHFDREGVAYGMNLMGLSRDYYMYMNNLMNNNTLNATMSAGNQEISFDVDPTLSANERISDNTALRLLYEIYNENDNPGLPWISTSYPKQKLFYILAAQEYCSKISMPEFMQKLFESKILPSTLRVKNIVTNSEEFSKTFECSRTQKEIDGVSYKIQFPYLENLDIQEFYNSFV